jgi:hypothetical protein
MKIQTICPKVESEGYTHRQCVVLRGLYFSEKNKDSKLKTPREKFITFLFA